MRGWKRKSLGRISPPFLFVLSLSLFLLLSTVLSSLCSWEPLTLHSKLKLKLTTNQQVIIYYAKIESKMYINLSTLVPVGVGVKVPAGSLLNK